MKDIKLFHAPYIIFNQNATMHFFPCFVVFLFPFIMNVCTSLVYMFAAMELCQIVKTKVI